MSELGKIYRHVRNTQSAVVMLFTVACLCLPAIATEQERPWSVSPCELLKHPGMYDETMVSVPGLVLYGGQEFTTHSYDCPDEYGVLRLEFGGNPTDPKDQFRLPQARLEAGTVPLKKDADYETTQRLMKSIDASGRIQMLRATLIGRFFAGQAVGTKSGEIKHPNAHLVISEVEIVSNKPEDPVDFSADPHLALVASKACSATSISVPSRAEADKLQRLSREPSENLDYLLDPRQVAARSIARQENLSAEAVAENMRVTKDGVAVHEYFWTSTDGFRSYTVTVNRPYWLLASTYSGDAVIWVPKRILLTTCAAKSAR